MIKLLKISLIKNKIKNAFFESAITGEKFEIHRSSNKIKS